jgi:hypothetical protein
MQLTNVTQSNVAWALKSNAFNKCVVAPTDCSGILKPGEVKLINLVSGSGTVRKNYLMVRSTITTREVYFDDWKTVHSYAIEEFDGSGEPVQCEGPSF